MKALCIDGRPYLGLTTGEIYDIEHEEGESFMYKVSNDFGNYVYALQARFDVIEEGENGQEPGT